ncbi:MAG: STY4199 family HEPN domain-containing protein [Planctomycetota bacterium]
MTLLATETLAPRVARAYAKLLSHVGIEAPVDDVRAALKAWARAKAERGGKALAGAVGLSEAELAAFEAAGRDVERTLARRAESDAPADERNAVLALVRELSWLETIEGQLGVTLVDVDLGTAMNVDVGHKQVRALELIVRSLVTESYGDQDALLARLRAAMNEKVVAGWQAKADPGDILSGLTFSELASLFVDKDEFTRYETLYEDTPFLTLLKQRRRTIQSFLDDVRRIRNVLAHNKRVTPTQLTLLDLYYEEIVGPVQTAHDQGETRVDPGTYLDVGRDELERWVGGLEDDVQAVRDDLADLRADLTGQIAGVREDTQALRKQATGIDRKLIAIGAGVIAVLVGLFFVLKGGGETKEAVEQAREETVRTGEAARDAAAASRDAAGASREATDASRDAAAASREASESSASAEQAAKAAEEAARETADRVEDSASRVEDSASRVEDSAARVEETSGAAKEAAEAARAAAEEAAATTEQVARSIDDLKEGFAALLKEGGTIVDADRPEAWYHNARVYEQRGDTAKAMEAYRRYFATTKHGFVDPHLRYQAVLKLQNGMAGAREQYFAMKEASPDLVTDFAWRLLLPPEARTEQLMAFAAAHTDFAPVWYEISRDVSLARLGKQSLEDKRQEKEALERFLALAEEGSFLGHYLDQQVAAAQLDDARERLASARAVADDVLENPVTLNAMQSNAGWGLTFIIAEEAREILWRRKNQGEFKSTGQQPGTRSASGFPMPVMYVAISDDTPGVIEVKYVDAKGRERGPYELTFDPEQQRIAMMKSTLEMTSNGWLSFRDWDGKVLVYFTQLISMRAGIKEVRWSLDSEDLDRVWALPAFDPANPYAVPDDATIYVEVPATTKYAAVQLTYRDGTTSDVKTFKR